MGIEKISFWKRFSQFMWQRPVYHGLLWLLYASIILLLNSRSEGFGFATTNVFIHVFFVAALVYINLFFLLPKYFSKQRFLTYLLLSVFVTMVATPLEVICLYWNLKGLPAAQMALLDNQTGHFTFLFISLYLSSVLKITKEWFVQQRVQGDLERRNLQSELSFLKSQINPHFLFNTLNSLYALTLKKSDKAPEIVLRLSEMMRYMLYECNEKSVPLEREIQYIQNYLELEKVRYGNKATIEFDYIIDDIQKYQIAPLLFITFLENSFKHGLSLRIDGGFVSVLLQIEEGILDFNIENSKGDLRDERYFQGGIGLKNVQRRLELIYPKAYQLDTEETEKTYSVHLALTL